MDRIRLVCRYRGDLRTEICTVRTKVLFDDPLSRRHLQAYDYTVSVSLLAYGRLIVT